MTRKQKRLVIIGGGVTFIAAAVLLVMVAFSQAIAYFYVPGDLMKADVAPGTRIRLGGLVETGSLKRGEGMTITFSVTDYAGQGAGDLYGHSAGPVPRGAGCRGRGEFSRREARFFVADTVLAKHDETYMPKDVADRLKAQGVNLGGKENIQ